MDRKYAEEMRLVIDEATAQGPYVSRSVARDIVSELQENDPQLLNGWLMEQAEALVWAAINFRDRSRRSTARASSTRTAFAQAAAEAEGTASPEPLERWMETRFVVNEGRLRKQLMDLDHEELTYVANSYVQRAQSSTFEAAFFRALARKVSSGTVKNHFTEAQLVKLRETISFD